MNKRVGVLGGTFDPIHIGHLILAEEARYQLQLDALSLLPAGDPPHKQERVITPVAQRLHMLELALADLDYAHISLIDVNRPGPHYTVDTIQLLQAELGPQTDIYFLMGMDSLRDLPTWYKPQWLVDNCRLVALSRPDVEIDWPTLTAALPGVRDRVIILDMPKLEIASSRLRARVRRGEPIRFQVPDGVAEYIVDQQLYGPQTSQSKETAMTVNLSKIQQRHIALMQRTRDTLAHLLRTLPQADATTFRDLSDGPKGWTTLEVLCHLRDFDGFFRGRAAMMRAQEQPMLPAYDHEALAVERNYNAQSLQSVLDEFIASRNQTIAFFEGLTDDEWTRDGTHPEQGPFAMTDAAMQVGLHDATHIEQITRILTQCT